LVVITSWRNSNSKQSWNQFHVWNPFWSPFLEWAWHRFLTWKQPSSDVAWRLGLHPSTLACLSSSYSNFQKEVPLGPMNGHEDNYLYLSVIICYLYALWRDEKQKPVGGRDLPYPSLFCEKSTNTLFLDEDDRFLYKYGRWVKTVVFGSRGYT
jgi:hypothetical protein